MFITFFYFTWQLILHFIFHTFYGHVPFCLNFDALLLSVSSQVSLLQIKDFVNILVFLFYASSSSISSSLGSTLRWTTMMIFVCPLGPIKHYTHIIGICIALKDNITHLNINLFIMVYTICEMLAFIWRKITIAIAKTCIYN